MFNSKRRKRELKELEELRLRIKEYEELETAGLEEVLGEINRLNDCYEILSHENENLIQRCDKLEAFARSLREMFLSLVPDDADYGPIYYRLADVLYSGGFRLHQVAKKITGIDVSYAFPTEDNLGYFEEADGYELVEWIIKAKYGQIEWVQLNSPYEKAGNVSFEGKEEDIATFYKELYKETVLQLLS